MTAKPYVGVTGIANNTEAEEVAKIFLSNGFLGKNSSHMPMLGYLASFRTIKDMHPNTLTTPNIKYPNWRVLRARMKKAAAVFGGVGDDFLNMIHYTTKEKRDLGSQVIDVFRERTEEYKGEEYYYEDMYNSGLCRAVQINVPWPELNELEKILFFYPDMKIVLQISKTAMENLCTDRHTNYYTLISDKVKEYQNMISYALIDPSMGKGREFDVEKSTDLYEHIRDKCPD